MRAKLPGLLLLWCTAFALAVGLEPCYRAWLGEQHASADVLTLLLGDSRKLFARQMYAKADAYFHRGYYPSVFEHGAEEGALHIAAGATGGHEEMEAPREASDWLERFSRHFQPSEHLHVGDRNPARHGEQRGSEGGQVGTQSSGEERELLPWLRLAAELDPGQPETFVVTSFWLRSYLNRPEEAERCLREGLRSNPNHPELLFELGRIYRENKKLPDRARDLWELALVKLEEGSPSGRDGDLLLRAQVLGNLAKVEEERGHPARAVVHLRKLAVFSPNRPQIEKWIETLEQQAQPEQTKGTQR